jgi:hypothetical protein
MAVVRLFGPDAGVTTGAAGRRDHRRIAGIGRWRAHLRIDPRRRAQHTVGFGQLITQRLPALTRGYAFRSHIALPRRFGRRAAGGTIGRTRRGLGRRRCGRWRRLGIGHAGRRHHDTREQECGFHCHAGKTARRCGGSAPERDLTSGHFQVGTFRICGSGSAKNGPSAASGAVRLG